MKIIVREVSEYLVEVDESKGTMTAEIARVDETSLLDAAKQTAILVVRGMVPEATAKAFILATSHKSSKARSTKMEEVGFKLGAQIERA